MATKKELEKKKELAELLYMKGESQKSIAEKIEISENTLSGWVNKEGWDVKRAGKKITRPDLVNRSLVIINRFVEELEAMDDPTGELGKAMDTLAKSAAFIKSLEKETTIVDTIEVSISLSKWIEYRLSTNPKNDVIMFDFIEKVVQIVKENKNISPRIASEFQKTFNKYQDLFINEQMSK